MPGDNLVADASGSERVLYLVRHCQSAGQEPDAPLTALGHAQAELLADRLLANGIVRVVASPYLRATQSIAPLARRLALSVETDVRLVERVLSPEPLDDWRERLRAAWDDHDLVLPGGESSREATARGMAAVLTLMADERRPVVVVTHGNLLALILHAIDGRPGYATWEQLTNPDLFEVTCDPISRTMPARWRVTRLT